MAPTSEPLSRLRQTLGLREIDFHAIEKLLGTEDLEHLRRTYFPRWRPGTVHSASPALRAYRRVLVSDPFEEKVVRVLAPPEPELQLQVDIVPKRPAQGQGRSGQSTEFG